jgi:hypothetical protein
MKSNEFAYWLQGWFEIGEGPLAMSPRQKRLVRDHLDLVFKHEGDSGIAVSGFCQWLDGVFTVVGSKQFDTDLLAMVQERLNKEFLHVIDQTYPAEQQDALNTIHFKIHPVAEHPILMGKDGVTPDSGLHWDKNSHNYDPQARC